MNQVEYRNNRVREVLLASGKVLGPAEIARRIDEPWPTPPGRAAGATHEPPAHNGQPVKAPPFDPSQYPPEAPF